MPTPLAHKTCKLEACIPLATAEFYDLFSRAFRGVELLPHKLLLTKAKLQKFLFAHLFAFCAKINFDGNTRFRVKPVRESC